MIGPNGSGKSNFIGVFAFLHGVRAETGLKDYVIDAGGAEKVLHFGSKTTREIFTLASHSRRDNTSMRLRPTADDGLYE